MQHIHLHVIENIGGVPHSAQVAGASVRHTGQAGFLVVKAFLAHPGVDKTLEHAGKTAIVFRNDEDIILEVGPRI